MPKKYYKLHRANGLPGVAVINNTIGDLERALGALLRLGEQPEEITAAEARRLKDALRLADAREKVAERKPSKRRVKV